MMTTETSTSGRTSVQVDYLWTSGDDSALSHLRKIDAGAYGEVHEVLQSSQKVLKRVSDA